MVFCWDMLDIGVGWGEVMARVEEMAAVDGGGGGRRTMGVVASGQPFFFIQFFWGAREIGMEREEGQ